MTESVEALLARIVTAGSGLAALPLSLARRVLGAVARHLSQMTWNESPMPTEPDVGKPTRVFVTDDIGGDATESTVHFSLDGIDYDIDLSAADREQLRNALAPFVAAAHEIKARKVTSPRPRSNGASATDVDAKAVRAWAKSRGLPVSTRGRVPAAVVAQYRAAGN